MNRYLLFSRNWWILHIIMVILIFILGHWVQFAK